MAKTLSAALPFEVEDALKRIGRNIRTARLRRGLTAEALGQRLGVTRQTVSEAERGNPRTSAGVYVGLLWALGLSDQLSGLAAPQSDEEGMALLAQREPKRARMKADLDNDF